MQLSRKSCASRWLMVRSSTTSASRSRPGNRKKPTSIKPGSRASSPRSRPCFVDYGAERHGFLPLKEVSKEYFRDGQPQGGRMNIRELLSEGPGTHRPGREGRARQQGRGADHLHQPRRPLPGADAEQPARRRRLAPHRGRRPRPDARGDGAAADSRRHGRDRPHRRRRPHRRGAAVGPRQPAHAVGRDRRGHPRAAPRRSWSTRKAMRSRARMRDYLGDDIGEILVDDTGRVPEGAGIHAALHAAGGAAQAQAATPTTCRCSRASRSRARSSRPTRTRCSCPRAAAS